MMHKYSKLIINSCCYIREIFMVDEIKIHTFSLEKEFEFKYNSLNY